MIATTILALRMEAQDLALLAGLVGQSGMSEEDVLHQGLRALAILLDVQAKTRKDADALLVEQTAT